jgi:4-coumarate--CoA ligase
VKALSRSVAAGLRSRFGIGRGDVVCVVLPNMPEYPIIVFGILAAGGVFTGANTSSHADELEKQIVHADVKLVFADAGSYEKVMYELAGFFLWDALNARQDLVVTE